MKNSARFVVLAVVVMFLAAAGGICAWIVIQAQTQAQDAVLLRLQQQAKNIAASVGNEVQEDVAAVTATADFPGMKLSIINKRYSGTTPFLSTLIKLHPRIASVGVYDSLGRLSARLPSDATISGRRFSQQEYFSTARNSNEPHISSLFIQIGKPKGTVIAYSYRIRCRVVCGVLVGTTPITTFDAMVTPYASSEVAVRVYDSKGELISPTAEASGRSYASDRLVGPALKGRSVALKSGHAASASAPVRDIGWAVVVSQPTATAFKNADRLRLQLASAGAAVFLLAIVSAFLASRGAVTAQPVDSVQETERSLRP